MRTAEAAKTAKAARVLLAALTAPAALAAQASFQLSLGARYTSTLVHDSIVAPFDVRPSLAPLLAVSATTRLDSAWSAGATLDFSWSRLERHDREGATADLGGLSTLAFTINLRRRLRSGVEAEGAVGELVYLPGSKTGIFALGTGGITPLGAVGLTYAPAMAAVHRLTLRARYDIHRFVTPALRNEGFASGNVVHRVALAVRWSFGAEGRP